MAFVIKDGITTTSRGVTTFKLGIVKEGILHFKISSQYNALNEYITPIEKALKIISEDFDAFGDQTYQYYEAISFSSIIDKADKEFGIGDAEITEDSWQIEALDGSDINNAKILLYSAGFGKLADFLALGEGKFKITFTPSSYTKPLYTVVINVVDIAK